MQDGPKDNTIIGRVLLIAGSVGAMFVYMFNNWGIIEPALMSPVGGIGWSLFIFSAGATGYHFAVHAPVLARLKAAEAKLNRMSEERLADREELGTLRGRMMELERRGVIMPDGTIK